MIIGMTRMATGATTQPGFFVTSFGQTHAVNVVVRNILVDGTQLNRSFSIWLYIFTRAQEILFSPHCKPFALAASLKTMEFKKYKTPLIWLLVIICLIILFNWDERLGRNSNRIIHRNDLTNILGTLTNQPTIETAEQGGPWVPIELFEFPEFKFNISGVMYNGLKAKAFVENVKIGDTILLSILTYDYKVKIKKALSSRISDDINYRFILPYEVTGKQKKYLTIESANKAWKDEESLYWFKYLLVGVMLLPVVLIITGHIKVNEETSS